MDIYAVVIWIVVALRLRERMAVIVGQKDILFIDFLQLKSKISSKAWSFSHAPVKISWITSRLFKKRQERILHPMRRLRYCKKWKWEDSVKLQLQKLWNFDIRHVMTLPKLSTVRVPSFNSMRLWKTRGKEGGGNEKLDVGYSVGLKKICQKEQHCLCMKFNGC